VDWIHLAQDAAQWPGVLGNVLNALVSLKAGNFFPSCVTVSFSRGLVKIEIGFLISSSSPKISAFQEYHYSWRVNSLVINITI
jgi:hypothetical protein